MQICYARCNVVDSKSCKMAGKPQHRKDSIYFFCLMSPCPWIWVTPNLGVWCNSGSLSDLQSLITMSFMEISSQMWRKSMLPWCKIAESLMQLLCPQILCQVPAPAYNRNQQSWKPQETYTSFHHVRDFQLKALSILIPLSILDNYWTWVVKVLHTLN